MPEVHRRQRNALKGDIQRMVDRVEKANSTTSKQEFIRSLEQMKSWLSRIEKRRTEHTDNVQELKVAKNLAQPKDGTFQKRFTDLGLSGMSCRQIKYQEVGPICQRQGCRKCRFNCVCCNPERESQE
ncbi:hypothetical protein ACGI40_22870 [Escherichia coli]|uniref:hypothetical protein n=1 Tax=Escherichia coli TaxID=562 RepID=UPI000D168D53|nr:hypothetical protein [Escherichia coli]PSY45872.1 hypothetical protein C7B19_26360 [Escherichia coli]